METVTENEKIETKRNVKFDLEKGEIRVLGVRCFLIDPIPSCEKVDRMFGTGAEVIVHNMGFEFGYRFFDSITRNNPEKTRENLLTELVAAAPELGFGAVNIVTARENPPMVKVTVKNPAAKTVKGSQKQLAGSFWAGVLSKYFDKQLTCKDFVYDEKKDELSCVIST